MTNQWKPVTVLLPPEEWEGLKALCDQKKQKWGPYLRELLRQHINRSLARRKLTTDDVFKNPSEQEGGAA